jgi:hypothetical protein
MLPQAGLPTLCLHYFGRSVSGENTCRESKLQFPPDNKKSRGSIFFKMEIKNFPWLSTVPAKWRNYLVHGLGSPLPSDLAGA